MRSRRGTRKGGPRTTIVALALALVLALGGLAVASSAPRGPVVHTVALDAHPCELTLDPTGRYAFLSTYTSDPQTQTNTPARTVVFDLRTGARVRAVDVGTAPQAMAVDPGRGRLIVAGNGALALIDMRTGRVTTMTSASSIFDPIIVDDRRGRFYGIDNGAGGFRGNLDIFDARTGALLKQATLRASQDLDGTLNAGGVAADLRAGRIYVPYTTSVYGTTAMTDSVAVLDPSGRLLHTATIGHFSAQGGSALAAAVDPLHDRVVVVDNDTGDVSTLDARTGGIVRTLHLATVTPMRANMPARAFGSYAPGTASWRCRGASYARFRAHPPADPTGAASRQGRRGASTCSIRAAGASCAAWRQGSTRGKSPWMRRPAWSWHRTTRPPRRRESCASSTPRPARHAGASLWVPKSPAAIRSSTTRRGASISWTKGARSPCWTCILAGCPPARP